MKIASVLLLSFTLFICNKNDFFQAPDELLPYVERFVNEGIKRGFTIHPEKKGLIIEFGTLANNQLGRSKINRTPRILTINQEIWKDLDTFQKRALIFHELGHCLLSRKHKNKILERGECMSLLAGKEDNFECHQNLYSEIWWNYYLDELFNKKLELPNWYHEKYTNYHYRFDKNYLMNEVNPTFQLDSTISVDFLDKHYKNAVGKRGGWFFFDLDTTKNYQIEVTYETEKADYTTYKLGWKDLVFSAAPTYIKIARRTKSGNQAKWGIRTHFYKKELTDNPKLKKLTIRKIESRIYFFFNEQIIHLLEHNYPFGTEGWLASQINKDLLKTNFLYDEKAELKIEMAYLN